MQRTRTFLAATLLASAWVSPAVVACREPMDPVGVSHKDTPPPEAASGVASASASTWAHASSVASWPRANGLRFVSHGHWFGRYDADVHVKGGASAYAVLAPGSRLPEGTVIAEVLVERTAGLPGPIFSMEKTASGWIYVEVDARRNEVRRGRLEPCVTCHLQVADQDELFGLPPPPK